MTQTLLCITCPTGCRLQVTHKENNDDPFTVTGHRCRRGLDFAYTELTCPTRSLTTTVRTNFIDDPVLPVRTDGEIPKALITRAMQTLAAVVLDTPLACGETVLENICETGVRVIATADLPYKGGQHHAASL